MSQSIPATHRSTQHIVNSFPVTHRSGERTRCGGTCMRPPTGSSRSVGTRRVPGRRFRRGLGQPADTGWTEDGRGDGGMVRARHTAECGEVIASKRSVAFTRERAEAHPSAQRFPFVQTDDTKPRRHDDPHSPGVASPVEGARSLARQRRGYVGASGWVAM